MRALSINGYNRIVIPAQAGIQRFKPTGYQIESGMTATIILWTPYFLSKLPSLA